MIGRVVSHYRIIDKLGQGGMDSAGFWNAWLRRASSREKP